MPGQSFKLYLVGPFRLEDAAGRLVEVKGKKSRAILAILGTGIDKARARAWIEDHLWSGREPKQARASYRQCILELRRALGTDSDLLQAGAEMLALDPTRIWVDADDADYLATLSSGQGEPPVFLADLAIPDPAFERWLTDRRDWIKGCLAPVVAASAEPLQRPIVIRGKGAGDGAAATTFNAVMQDLICKSIDDNGRVQLVDEATMPGLSRADAERAFRVQVNSLDHSGGRGFSVNLTRSVDGTIFSNLIRLSGAGGSSALQVDGFDVIDLVNEAVEQSLNEIAGYEARIPEARLATALCFRAMKSITDYSPDALHGADRLLAKAYDIDPQPVFLAWRAYLRTFLLGEGGADAQSTREEMEHFISLAEEQEPGNSIILSLAAFIRSMWLLSNEEAFELAQRSNTLNPTNPFGISYLGMVHTHLGNFEEGYRLTRRANSLRVSPTAKSSIRYVAMRSAACAGHYAEALRIGEALGRDAPNFTAPKRLMGLLYMKSGRTAEAEAMVEIMRRTESDYSLEKMRDSFRASPLLHRSDLGKET